MLTVKSEASIVKESTSRTVEARDTLSGACAKDIRNVSPGCSCCTEFGFPFVTQSCATATWLLLKTSGKMKRPTILEWPGGITSNRGTWAAAGAHPSATKTQSARPARAAKRAAFPRPNKTSKGVLGFSPSLSSARPLPRRRGRPIQAFVLILSS